MTSSYVFQTSAEWTSGRKGVVRTEPDAISLAFSAPPEFQGEAGYWSPEHLLLAAGASAFVTTFRAIAEMSHFEFASLAVPATGVLEKGDGRFEFTQIFLKPELGILRDSDHDRALRLLQKAEKACLISRSLRSKITVEPAIATQAYHAEMEPEQLVESIT